MAVASSESGANRNESEKGGRADLATSSILRAVRQVRETVHVRALAHERFRGFVMVGEWNRVPVAAVSLTSSAVV